MTARDAQVRGLEIDLKDQSKLTPLLWILAISLVARIGVLILVAVDDPGRFFTNDSYSYHRPAEALAFLGALAPSPDQPEKPQTLRTPGYPLFLAAIYKVCASRPTVAIAVQAVLGLGTLWLLFVLARRAWDDRTALLAAALLALDMISFVHALMVLTETLFTLLLMAAVVMLDTWWRRGMPPDRLRWLGLAGLLFAVATLVRPISYYLLPFLALGIALSSLRRGSWRWALTTAGTFLLPAIVLLGAWQARNYERTGVAILSRVEGINLLFFRGAAVVALRDGISYEEARRRLGWESDPGLHAATAGLGELASMRYAREGRELILRHPWLFLRVTVRGMAQLLAAPGDGSLTRLLGSSSGPHGPLGDLRRLTPAEYARQWLGRRPLAFTFFLVAASHLVIVYVGVLGWGLSRFRARRLEDKRLHVLVWGTVVYLLVLSAGPEAGYRLRVPLMPFLILYAAPGLRWLLSLQTTLSPRSLGKAASSSARVIPRSSARSTSTSRSRG